MPKRIALLIGNGRFQDPTELPDLRGPANDVQQLARVLRDQQRGDFTQVLTCVDQEHHDILLQIERELTGATRDDLVLIYYSGHGKRNASGNLCLATANTRIDVLNATSLPFANLKQLIDDSTCGNVVLMLDCCFSGAASAAYGLRGSVADQLQNIARETAGLHILTSSASYQTSQEREHVRGGVVLGDFTACILDGIDAGMADENGDGIVHLSELRNFIHKQLTGQSPQYWGFRVHGDPVISVNPRRQQANGVRQARRRLAGWYRNGSLPKDIFFAALDAMPQEADDLSNEQQRIVDLLCDERCQPDHFLVDWESIHPEAAASPPERPQPPRRSEPESERSHRPHSTRPRQDGRNQGGSQTPRRSSLPPANYPPAPAPKPQADSGRLWTGALAGAAVTLVVVWIVATLNSAPRSGYGDSTTVTDTTAVAPAAYPTTDSTSSPATDSTSSYLDSTAADTTKKM